MKKILFLILMFFSFALTTKASSPAGFVYDGPNEAKQGETISYDLKVRDGNYFFVYRQNDEDNFWSHEIEYDKHVLQFVSFKSDISKISVLNNENEETLTFKIEEDALGPYTEGQVIGKIVFKVLEDSPLGAIKLSQPTGIEGIGIDSNNAELYKIVNITKKEDIKSKIEESNTKSNKEDNNILYLLMGVLSLSNIILAVAVLVIISKNKNK